MRTFLLIPLFALITGWLSTKAQEYNYKMTYLNIHFKNEIFYGNKWLMNFKERSIVGKMILKVGSILDAKSIKVIFHNSYDEQMHEILFNLKEAEFDKAFQCYRIQGTDIFKKKLAVIFLWKLSDWENLKRIGVMTTASDDGGLMIWDYTLSK